MGMFCFQCEQASRGTGCEAVGVCGKDPRTAALQDLLISAIKQISAFASLAGSKGMADRSVDRFVADALFTTVTNVNFSEDKLKEILWQSSEVLDRAMTAAGPGALSEAPLLLNQMDRDQLVSLGGQTSLALRRELSGADIAGLQELVLYGLKGMAAYVVHAALLGYEDPEIYAFIHRALAALNGNMDDAGQLVALALECGQKNLRAMELLDQAHTETYGHPTPTSVRVNPVKGKAILVSGHDLKDLKALLEQTEGTGINIYTHGEMLPAHGYPELNKHQHLVGNYGGAWQDQAKEFAAFPGAILMTTNCIQQPLQSYRGRIFTTGLVSFPGVEHVSSGDFGAVLSAARQCEGFADDGEDKRITVGFGRQAVLGVAGAVVDAVKAGQIRHFFLIGGCDGAKSGRNYYSEFAAAVPNDGVILTLACGKFRFNKNDFGDIGGIPRLLDIGQCNDAYSAIVIAQALADAFGCDVNSLPLSLILSWYEQKAVAILLTLLSLGIKNIRLGPTLPAFLTPAVIGILQQEFNLQPIKSAEEDLAACLAA